VLTKVISNPLTFWDHLKLERLAMHTNLPAASESLLASYADCAADTAVWGTLFPAGHTDSSYPGNCLSNWQRT
jgi:hypothetical protein